MADNPRRKIMIVDDNEVVREVVQTVLAERGNDVIALESPFDFAATLQREKPDLVLMDVNMPALQGDVIVGLVGPYSLHKCPIVLHSDRSETELEDLVARSGAAGFIRKTGDPDELWHRIEEFLAPGEE